MTLDRIDRRILDLLQCDATMPVARIAERVGLSQTPCWKRIKKLEARGVIRARVALVDPDAVGMRMTAFLVVEPAEQSPGWRDAFAAAIAETPAAGDVHRLAGRSDFLVRVTVADLPALDALVEGLKSRVAMRSCEVMMSAERVRSTTAIALGAAA